jgi:hypothetical protein
VVKRAVLRVPPVTIRVAGRPEWAQLDIVVDPNAAPRILGHENASILISRFQRFVDGSSNHTEPWQWIASFSDPHGACYGRWLNEQHEGDEVAQLLWQDADATTIVQHDVPARSLSSWLIEIRRLDD